MPDRRFGSTRRDQFSESVEYEPRAAILLQVRSRQDSVPRVCKLACRLTESVGSLLGPWLTDRWSEPS
jgi:hypothetical protein